MPVSFARDTITIIRAARVDERGDEILDWDDTDEWDIGGCSVQPMATEEVKFTGSAASEGGTARSAIVTRWKVYAPADADVEPLDRVRYRDVEYDVEGQVQDWSSPTGALDHTAFELRHVDG
jgi:hypothetical protein